jgi:hypothetical protein
MINNSSSREEKAEVLKNDRDTMHSRALNDVELGQGGRFARKSQVIGEGMIEYPKAAEWVGADQGIEPPFPIDISELAPTGEPFEIQASLERNASADQSPITAGAGPETAAPSVNPPADVFEPVSGRPNPKHLIRRVIR